MIKLLDFENPISGSKGNLLNLSSLWSMILGVAVTMFIFATGQNIAKKVSNVVPALDTTIEPVIANQPVKVTGTNKRLV